MSAALLTYLSVLLMFVGGLALGYFARKWSEPEPEELSELMRRELRHDAYRDAFHEAALEAESVGKALAPSSIVWKAIVRRLMEMARPATPPSVTIGAIYAPKDNHFVNMMPLGADTGEGDE